ncbi:MAG TPA: hypothetical protein PLV45_13435 [bacterium]|nr:hypothetical protein [bacterium]
MIRRLLVIAALFIPIAWSLPTWQGYREETGRDQYSREFLGWIRSDDFHRYGSFIDQTRYHHAFFYQDYSAVEPQSPRMMAVYFYCLGITGILTGLPAETLWLLSRFIAGWVFILVFLRFLSVWTADRSLKNTALFLVVFSTGFEYLGIFDHVPWARLKNTWMDGFSTFCSFHNPLKIAGIIGVLLLFISVDRYLKKPSSSGLWATSLLILAAWAVHPNSAIPGYTGILATVILVPPGPQTLRRIRERFALLLPLAIPVGGIAAYIAWMRTDPVTANITRQYSIKGLVEPYMLYPIRYGIILPLGLVGMMLRLRRRSIPDVMLTGMLLGGELFAHFAGMSGLLFQHMLHLPMAMLAAVTVEKVLGDRKVVRRAVFAVLIAGFFFQHIGVIRQVMQQTAEDVWPTSLYWTRGELMAAERLRDMPPGNVLASRDSGNKIAWKSLHHVLLGHWGTTPDRGMKETDLRRFFDPGYSREGKRRILEKYRIRYIWYGPTERSKGLLDHRLDLHVIYENAAVTLYRVQPDTLNSSP